VRPPPREPSAPSGRRRWAGTRGARRPVGVAVAAARAAARQRRGRPPQRDRWRRQSRHGAAVGTWRTWSVGDRGPAPRVVATAVDAVSPRCPGGDHPYGAPWTARGGMRVATLGDLVSVASDGGGGGHHRPRWVPAGEMTPGRIRRGPPAPATAAPRRSVTTRRGGALVTAQLRLSCVHAQTRFSCRKLRKNLADRPGWGRKRRFRPQQFAQRKCASSGLSTLHHPNHLGALSTALAFPQSERRLPALHKKLRRQHLTEGAELQNDHVAYAVGIDNLPTVSSPCSWPTTATHAVMRSILIDDWIMETLSRHGDWLRVALDSWRFSLFQLVGHPVKCKPPTLAASPAVLPQFFNKSTPLRRALRRGF